MLCSLSAVVLAAHVPARADEVEWNTWGHECDTLRVAAGLNGAARRLTLSYPYLVPSSESVTLGGAPLARDNYQINYQLGTLLIVTPVADGATVVVEYRRAPFFLDPVYALRPSEVSEPAGEEEPVQRAAPREPTARESAGRNLVFGGTKSVSFSLGSNRGTSLDQTLQATIEGELTPTIKVRALLSDNNLPIQPEGNTEELEYLDKVFVEIEGTHARATLGDFGFANRISTFSPFTRQLKGISTEAWTGKNRVTVAGATAKGVFKTVKFRGTTGLQGPYELLSAARNTGEVVIAGTERVFVDGVEFKRGQNQDYVIDYDQGNVTFTPRHLITNDTEISVDFEASQEKYDRNAVFTAAETGLPGGVTLQVLAARERDDKDQPRNVSLDAAERDVLGAAGDDPAAAITGGVVATPGKGNYNLVPADSLGPARYEFADSTGDFIVVFVEVGVGHGDYTLGGISSAGRPYYTWVGAGLGNYTPGKALPLPESLGLVTARARRDGEHVDVDAEWNVSEHDKNLFSPLDDDDNVGDAGRLRLAFDDLPAGKLRLGIAGTVSTLEDRFTSFDRVRPSYFYRDWNLENAPLVGREVLGEGEATVALAPARLRYALGRLSRDDVDGTKHDGGVTIGDVADRGVDASAFDTRTERGDEVRTRRHLSAQTIYGLWHVAPSVNYSTERYLESRAAAPDSGIAFELVGARLGTRHTDRFAASVSVETRDTEEIAPGTDTWRDTRTDRTVTGRVSSYNSATVRGELLATHREEDDRVSGGTRTSDLARVKSTIRVDPLGVRTDIDYEISQNQTRILQRSVVFVGEGKGDYNAQGEPVGKGKGDHTLVYSPTTTTQPTHRVDLSWRLVWRRGATRGEGERGGALGWVVRNVSLDQTVRVHEETSYDPAWKVYFMLPSALQRDESTLEGSTSIRQDWSLLDGVKNTSLTVRYQRDDEEENRFEGTRENRFSGEHTVRLSRSLSALVTATGQVSRGKRRRDGEGIPVGTGSAYDVTRRSALGGIGLRFSAGSSADIDVTYTDQEDAESGARQTLAGFNPRLSWRVGDHVNVFGSYELTQTWDRTDTAVRPIFFTSAGDSHRWTLTPNIRVTKMITVVASYQGRSEKGYTGTRITEHELRLETRAFF